MLRRSRPKLDLVSDSFTVKVNSISIERVTVYKSFGVLVDENLTWKSHMEEISKKISTGLSVLKRISPAIPIETRQTTYKALILPHFDYSSCVWNKLPVEARDQESVNLFKSYVLLKKIPSSVLIII